MLAAVLSLLFLVLAREGWVRNDDTPMPVSLEVLFLPHDRPTPERV